MPRRPAPIPAALPDAFTRAEGLAAGIPAARMQGGQVFCRPHASELDCVRAWARTLPPGWVPSHHTAALLLGLPLPPRAPARPGFIEVPLHASGPRGTRPQRRDASYHEVELSAADVVEACGTRVTRPARVFRDLAHHLALVDLVALGDRALAAEQSLDVLASSVSTLRRGRRRALRALPLLNKRAETPQESVLRVLLAAAGLPAAEPQVEIVVRGSTLARADLLIEAFRTVVEHLGVDHFDPRKTRADYDPQRRRRVHRADYEYVEVTSSLRTVAQALTAVINVAEAVALRGWPGEISPARVIELVDEAQRMRPPWRRPSASASLPGAWRLPPADAAAPQKANANRPSDATNANRPLDA